MKVIAVAQLSNCPDRNERYQLKFRIFRSDDFHTQRIMDSFVEVYQTKTEDIKKSMPNFCFFYKNKG